MTDNRQTRTYSLLGTCCFLPFLVTCPRVFRRYSAHLMYYLYEADEMFSFVKIG